MSFKVGHCALSACVPLSAFAPLSAYIARCIHIHSAQCMRSAQCIIISTAYDIRYRGWFAHSMGRSMDGGAASGSLRSRIPGTSTAEQASGPVVASSQGTGDDHGAAATATAAKENLRGGRQVRGRRQ